MSKRVVMVTGGLGFIGSHVCQRLSREGADVVSFDNVGQGKMDFLKKIRFPNTGDKIKFVQGDITDFPIVFETIKNHGVTEIIHTAAITFIPTAIKMPSMTFKVNTLGTFNLLEASRILELEKFVYISTTSAYGDFQYTPIDEKHPLEPKEIYGATKAAADRLTIGYNKSYSLPASIIRTSSVYGPGDLENRAAKAFIENALSGKPMELQGGGLVKRAFSYVKDVANGMVEVLNSDKANGEVFNITGTGEHSIKELAELIKEFIPGAEIKETPGRRIDVKRGKVSTEKARKMLGYEPKYGLRSGIKEYINWFMDIYVPIMDLDVVNAPVIK